MLAPQPAPPYELMGGATAVERLVDRFYQLMDSDARFAALRGLHEADLSEVRQSLFEFLSGWLGGPPLYFQGPRHRCVMSAHAKIPIGQQHVDQWLACMDQAMTDCQIVEELQGRVHLAFSAMANRMRNQM
jgi:hemoglobin